MEDEIKEILNYFIKYMNVDDCIRLSKIEDYITNLQKENEQLKKNQRYCKKGVFSLEYDKETLRDMLEELQQENERLKEQIEILMSDEDNNVVWLEDYNI